VEAQEETLALQIVGILHLMLMLWVVAVEVEQVVDLPQVWVAVVVLQATD
jgi:hypothetical protein